ncbi:MAG: hypothetical protein B6D76_17695 [gamma proteobacterium symbiont of Stewartia floridana]|nr:MAG: hypothetical protein B6D76_17695 [gamma proteobacterium symbiont of Stewartia floridana]
MSATVQSFESQQGLSGGGPDFEWPSPVPLDAAELPEFPEKSFIGPIGDMVDGAAKATETPPELAGSFALAVLSTACQKRFIVEPEVGYTEPLSLWMVSALPPGNRKTSVQKMMVAPLTEWERDQARLMEDEIRQAKSKKATQEARISELRKKAARAKAEDYLAIEDELAYLESNPVCVPSPQRLIAQDVTPEHLGEMMAENDERMAIISDEGGIFETIGGRYSGGIPNLDLFLKSHSGSDVRVDRRSRPGILMDAPALSIGLCPQPDVLRGLTSKEGFRGRGLLARFLYSLPRSTVGYRTLEQNPVPEPVKEAYKRVIHNILEISPGIDDTGHSQPYKLKLSDSAHSKWKAFQRQTEIQMQPGQRFQHIQDWAGKLPGEVIRIAGVLHCAEHAGPRLWEKPIGTNSMMQALDLAEMYSQYALVVFDLMGMDDEISAARRVWAWVESNRAGSFTKRECYRALRGIFPKVAQLTQPLLLLSERGYIRRVSNYQSGPGRKAENYLVNDRLVREWC